jgi:plastocyanin
MACAGKWLRLAAAVGGGMLIAGAAFGSGAPARAASTSVAIMNFAFTPASVTIAVGDTVTWTNTQSGVTHTVTADDGSFDSGRLPSGQSFSMTFTHAGTIPYHCNIHPSMHGTIVVTAAAAGSAGQAAPTTAAATPPAPPAPPTVRATTQPPSPPAASRPATRPPASRTAAATGQRAAVPAAQRPAAQRPAVAVQPPAARVALPNTGTGQAAPATPTPWLPLALAAAVGFLGAVGLRLWWRQPD